MSKKYLDVMIDLETAGTTADCPILQIGAVPFTRTGEILDDVFEAKVSLASNILYGRHAQAATLEWWDKQDATIKEQVFSGTRDLKDMLLEFAEYLRHFDAVIRPWGNGSLFDIAILESAFTACGVPVPWKYSSVRDYRTLLDVASLKPPYAAGAHDALVDAKHQALWAGQAFLALVK